MQRLKSFVKKLSSPEEQKLLRLVAEGKGQEVYFLMNEGAGKDHTRDWERIQRLANARDSEGRSASFLAAMNGDVEMLRLLNNSGADFTVPTAAGQTPLQALLAVPEPTNRQRAAIGYLRWIAPKQVIDPGKIKNLELWESIGREFYAKKTASPTAVKAVAEAKNLPEDIEQLLKKYGGKKTRSRKTRRRQTRRRR